MTEPTTPPAVTPEEPKPPTTPEPPKPEEKPPTVAFSPEQEAELNRRMAAARKDGETDGKRKADEAAIAAKTKADQERERQEQEAKGEYETAKQTLTTERDTAITERDSLKDDVEKYETAIAPLITALETEIPVEGRKGYDDTAAALDRLNWLTERKELLVSLGTLDTNGTTKAKAWVPGTPKPNGDPKKVDDEAGRKAQSQLIRTHF